MPFPWIIPVGAAAALAVGDAVGIFDDDRMRAELAPYDSWGNRIAPSPQPQPQPAATPKEDGENG